MDKFQAEEMVKCGVDFSYFCKNYLMVPCDMGFVSFSLYDYQVRLFEHLESNKDTIFSKFRGGGFTSFMIAYSIWLCLFRENQAIYYISPMETVGHKHILDHFLKSLPNWMVGKSKNFPKKQSLSDRKMFLETGSEITNTRIGYAGKSEISNLVSMLNRRPPTTFILDECSMDDGVVDLWRAAERLITKQAIIFSGCNTDIDWFANTLDFAKMKMNKFSVYTCHYREHPELNNPEYVDSLKKKIGTSEWDIEYEQIPIVEEFPEEEVKIQKKKWRLIDEE